MKRLLATLLSLASLNVALPANGGPGISGGGNGVNHKLVDSYSRPVVSVPGYHGVVEPLIRRLQPLFPSLAITLRQKARKLNWLLIPESIVQLPFAVTGIPFSSDQIAYQINNEVYIDKKAFKLLRDDDERGRLIVHEIVMGLAIDRVNEANEFRARARAADPKFNSPDLTIQASGVRKVTSMLLDETLSEQTLEFQAILPSVITGMYPTAQQLSGGARDVALDTVVHMKQACAKAGGAEADIIKTIGVIGYRGQANLDRLIDRTCSEEGWSEDDCGSQKWYMIAAYKTLMGAVGRAEYGGTATSTEQWVNYFPDADGICSKVEATYNSLMGK